MRKLKPARIYTDDGTLVATVYIKVKLAKITKPKKKTRKLKNL